VECGSRRGSAIGGPGADGFVTRPVGALARDAAVEDGAAAGAAAHVGAPTGAGGALTLGRRLQQGGRVLKEATSTNERYERVTQASISCNHNY